MASEEEQNEASLHENFQQLRSLTNSTAGNTTSIIVDASRYIEELKEKVDKLNKDIETAQTSTDQSSSLTSPTVTVKPQEKGFLINVFSKKSCPGLLVSILEAFEELGLEVLDARVSCSDSFRLEAVSENEEQGESMDAQVVRQAVLQAIRNWHDDQSN